MERTKPADDEQDEATEVPNRTSAAS
jgi:hypothetical protein